MIRTAHLSLVTLAGLGCLVTGLADSVLADECKASWYRAGAQMQQYCNIGLGPNEMCLVQSPVRAEPRPPYPFSVEGQAGYIPTSLASLVGEEAQGGRGFTFLKVVTQGKDSAHNLTPFTQEVVLLAFGETTMRHIENFGPPEPLNLNPVCAGEMRTDNPADGGAVTRSMFESGGPDQLITNMLPQEQLELLGRSRSGDMLLVRVRNGATGWAQAQNIAMFKDDRCTDINVLQEIDPTHFEDVFLTTQSLARASRFEIESRPVDNAEEMQCTLDEFPPSGLLIFNPSGTPVSLTVNGVTLVMTSSALVSEYGDVFSVVVLEGTVSVTTAVDSRSARAGQAIYVKRANGRIDLASAGQPVRDGLTAPWCDQIYRLARAAFTTRGRLRVPVERINFCSYMRRPGYPLHPAMIDIHEAVTVEVPELRRRSYPEARRILADRGLRIGNVSGPKTRESYVVDQDPRPSSKVPPNSRVNFSLQERVVQIQVPDLRRLSLAEAGRTLAKYGLEVGKVSGPQTGGSYVANQSPRPGSMARPNSRVDLDLQAPTTGMIQAIPNLRLAPLDQLGTVEVPDLAGKSVEQAMAQLQAARLNPAGIEGIQKLEDYYVYGQSPQPGSKVPAGSTVTLRVQQVPM